MEPAYWRGDLLFLTNYDEPVVVAPLPRQFRGRVIDPDSSVIPEFAHRDIERPRPQRPRMTASSGHHFDEDLKDFIMEWKSHHNTPQYLAGAKRRLDEDGPKALSLF